MTKGLLIAATATTLSACGGVSDVKLPEGEDDFSCAALMFAANTIENSDFKADLDVVKSKYLTGATRYATAYALAKHTDDQQALADIKIKGYRMAGTIPDTSDKVPTAELVRRAKACAEAL